MSGRILHFPTPSLSARPPVGRVLSFARVVSECGLGDLDPRTQVSTLRRMAREDNLPLPMNPRYWRGKRQLGAAAIGRKSTWDSADFLEWQTRQSNDAPIRAASISHPAGSSASMRAAMQQRARLLKGRG